MTLTERHILIALMFITFGLTSCSEIKTSDAKKAFKYWAGTNLPADIEILNGQYFPPCKRILNHLYSSSYKFVISNKRSQLRQVKVQK